MTRLNLEFLVNASTESLISNLDIVFENLLLKIKLYLNLDLIYSDIKIIYSKEKNNIDNLKEDFYNIGVKRTQKDNFLIIYISYRYKKFIKLVLLREAYKCFIPSELQENEIVNVFINQKVEIDLQKIKCIEDWKEFRRKGVINYEFIESEYDRLENFLKQESIENRPSPFQFFLSYIRKNLDSIEGSKSVFFYLEKKGFYDRIYEDYTRRYTYYSDEILETIRVITEIFYTVKSYHSLLDYQRYFKNFKESGVIQTDLSLRKFTENMQWIKENSSIAPTYQINWFELEIESVMIYLMFHPIIEISKIFNFIKLLPFFTIPSYSKTNFGIEISGYFICPNVYLKDIIRLLKKLELDGIILEKKIYKITNTVNTRNLNCVSSKSIILNPEKKYYKKENELQFNIDYSYGTLTSNFSLLDWFLIDRIRHISLTGFGFERKSETLKSLKSDLLNEIESQRKLINEIKENLYFIHQNIDYRNELIELISNNQSYGFFYIKQRLYDYLKIYNLIIKILEKHPSILNYLQFQDIFKRQGISKTIEDNITFDYLKKDIFREKDLLNFRSIGNLKKKVKKYLNFYNIFKSFNDLKLFDLESIKNILIKKSLFQKIYNLKEKKLKKVYESYKIYKITYQSIENRLEDFSNNTPPIIHPNLLNSIMIAPRFTKFYPVLILNDTIRSRKGIEKIKWLFPGVIIVKMSEYKTSKKFIYLRVLMPNLRLKEKQLLYSTFYNLFKNDIIFCKSFFYSGFIDNFSRKDFYDLEREEFFYTEDLFEQFYSYIRNNFKRELKKISESESNLLGEMLEESKKISSLINEIDKRISKEHIDLKINNLNILLAYHKNLEQNLLDIDIFKNSKNDYFFKNYIKAIRFIPLFQSFGFGHYFMYFYPTEVKKIDFMHLLHNSFQKIKFPAKIDKSSSFLINFIWPYRNPNISLINWLNKSKKVIQEYCLFFIKKIFQIFHFNYNLSINEWDLDPNHFKSYFQNILFNPDYNTEIINLKEFNLGDLNISNYFSPKSPEFEALAQIYDRKSIDIKSYLGTRNYAFINQIIRLLEKKLIYPFISLKNLDLKDKIYIILPNIKKEKNNTILKIFSFFNIGFIYEIEGEYFIYGFDETIRFENGLMIKLYLPDCQLDEFVILFNLIFEYLKIDHYVLLNDLVDGKTFLKSIFGNLDFLKSYNPLKNLIWNNTDKNWRNHKLFTNKFEKIYPPLTMND